MPQYDHIGAKYDQASEQFYKLLEGKLMQNALGPELAKRPPGLKLLEFASGTGFYTSRVLSWTDGSPATTITSMDISQAMVDVNRAHNADAVSAGRLRLLTADGARPTSYAPDGVTANYFDGAFGGWFLNYAESRAGLRAMFDNIALNIKPGGFFVGVVPYPTEDLAARGRACKEPPLSDIYPYLDFTRELADGSGWYFTCHVDETLSFETAHHRRSVMEETAREAGFTEIEWSEANLPREEFVPEGATVKKDMSPEVYQAYKDVGILAVIKIFKK